LTLEKTEKRSARDRLKHAWNGKFVLFSLIVPGGFNNFPAASKFYVNISASNDSQKLFFECVVGPDVNFLRTDPTIHQHQFNQWVYACCFLGAKNNHDGKI
jgi:hypothetical protein